MHVSHVIFSVTPGRQSEDEADQHAEFAQSFTSTKPFNFVLAEPNSREVGRLVGSLQRSSRRTGGELGEIFFLLLLGALVFWLYYRVYIIGTESVLPTDWLNPKN
jgi:hypothetical protein